MNLDMSSKKDPVACLFCCFFPKPSFVVIKYDFERANIEKILILIKRTLMAYRKEKVCTPENSHI